MQPLASFNFMSLKEDNAALVQVMSAWQGQGDYSFASHILLCLNRDTAGYCVAAG